MEQEIATQVVGLGGPNDFSLWQLFLRADFVVKSVIVILLISSIYSKSLLNNLACPPPTQDIEMNSFANEGETEQFTNKSD